MEISPLAPPGGFPDLPEISGAEFASFAAGIRYEGRDDVMLVRLASGTALAGVFTKSATRSASVLDCERKIALHAREKGNVSGAAILVNSGNANAFTGKAGFNAVSTLADAVATETGVPKERVLTASTGVIGEVLPEGKLLNALEPLKDRLRHDRIEDAARAIMTTDTFPKGAGAVVNLAEDQVRIAGIAKGSGMIAPDMATMLAFVFTDADIEREALQSMVTEINRRTFNAVTVDGDMSTSDTLIVAATGAAKAKRIRSGDSTGGASFQRGLSDVMENLAIQLVRDGEGATKLLEVNVSGAVSSDDAEKVAKSIANSLLVKTALTGEDPNWGRIVMAVGKSGAAVDRDRLSVSFGGIKVAENGAVADGYIEAVAAEYMRKPQLQFNVDLGMGSGSARVWTCDLSSNYVAINADYRS